MSTSLNARAYNMDRSPAPDVCGDEAACGHNGGYSRRRKIYPKRARGTFRSAKWIVMTVCLAIYYLLPWLRWDRGPGLPSQAILFDFDTQRLLFGPVEIWAQEFYYVTGVLVLSALALFLVTSVAGRMWCGFACPQTVWTDLMIAVERFWQGDRNARLRLDQQNWTFEKIWKKAATHLSWLAIAVATGGAFVFYFRDAPTLALELIDGTAPATAYAFLGLFTGTTYLLGGIAREQVCIYMCPWPRIQGAMLDRESLFISYRDMRGEPRGPHKKGASWEGRGDCIDCNACVAVCPMGIDIRDGAQLECIQCGLCIDACDEVMLKIERPPALIAYTTVKNLEDASAHPREGWRIMRPRTLVYGTLIAFVASVLLWSLLNRADFSLSVLANRNPIFVTMSDGAIRNSYTIKVANKLEVTRQFHLNVIGLPQHGTIELSSALADGSNFDLGPAEVQAIKVLVTIPRAAWSNLGTESAALNFVLIDTASNEQVQRQTVFQGPHP